MIDKKIYDIADCWAMALAVYIGCVILAYLCLKFYDEPIRRYLAKRVLRR